MLNGARVIIKHTGKVLLIHRRKNGKEYFVLPGGSIKKGETTRVAAIREVKEETNLDIELDRLLCRRKELVNGKTKIGYYFLAKKFKGKLALGGPELARQSKDNIYFLEWHRLSALKDLLLYPENIDRLIK